MTGLSRSWLSCQEMQDSRVSARAYTREHGEDIPEVSAWTWPSESGVANPDQE